MLYKKINSPIGKITLVASEKGLRRVLWENEEVGAFANDAVEGRNPILLLAEKQLAEYFAGTRQRFDVPLDLRGTPFQLRVWQALQEIPFGETRNYGQLAAQLGKPTAARAVGGANRCNPVGILVPCHRVIGANGTLTGFAGGLKTKEKLLTLEGIALKTPRKGEYTPQQSMCLTPTI